MHARILGIMSANHGLLTRSQALDNGLSPGDIRSLVRAGRLVLVRRGVYADGDLWRELDEFTGRPRLLTRAAIQVMHRDWVASHDSAAHELGLEILKPPIPHVHVTRPGFTGAWTANGVKHHLARFTPRQVQWVDDLPVLDMARTAVDIAREHGEPYGEVACDSALRHGVPRSALEAACAPMENWPFIRRTRQAVAFADPGAESVVETLGRLLVEALGIGTIETQFPVQMQNGRLFWGDIRVGCHLFEADGKVKYTPVAEGGVAVRSPTEVVWDEKKRERLLHQEGLGTSRIFFEDYWPPQRDRALARMREEYEETVARFGDRLPERLKRNAAQIRARHGA